MDRDPNSEVNLQRKLLASIALGQTGISPMDRTKATPRPAEMMQLCFRAERAQTQREKSELGEKKRRRSQLLREDAFFETEARRERTYVKLKAKITYAEPGKEYYANAPIQPGFLFWKSLLLNPKHPVRQLRMHIPDSLVILDKLYWASTHQAGHVQCFDQFSILDVYHSFHSSNESACAVLRIPEDEVTQTKAVLLSWHEFSEKVLKSQLPCSGIIQKYIQGRSGSRPAVTRLFYVSQSRHNKATYGFTITNTAETTGKVLCMETGLNVIPLCTAALTQVANHGRLIVEYLQLAHKVRIEEIVLDFMKDADDALWLIGCKGFKLDMTAQRTRELRASEEQGKSLAEVKELRAAQLERELSAMQCKLCLLPYRPDELCRVLPFKLLLMYKQRRNNQVLDMSHLRVNSIDFLSYCVRLCSICYMLVLQENELMDVEMRIARLLNVSIRPPKLLGEVEIARPTFMPGVLQQWRFLFYFKAITRIGARLYLQYRFLGRTQCTPLKSRDINSACLHYVFAPEGVLTGYCRTVTVTFRVTKGENWDAVVWSGECKPLSLFSASISIALIQPKEVLLFSDGEVQASLTVRVGIAFDKEVKSKELLMSIERMGGLYVPAAEFFSSDPLPEAWMEAFDEKYAGVDPSVILDSSEELQAMYTPTLPDHTVLAAPLGSTKVLHMNVNLNPLSTPKKPFQPTLTKRALHSPTMSMPQLPSLDSITEKLFSRTSSRATFCRTPLSSTASSSKVLYQRDSNKLKSPTFLSSRRSGTESGRTSVPFETDEDASSGESLNEVVAKYLKMKNRPNPTQGTLPTTNSGRTTPSVKSATGKRRQMTTLV